ncbi:MAG: sigma-E processing peptidase SpoIIGA [Eubacteriales bacterium]|nr:sigma-E processing peptidase SpoIIGA [Eubacteriales bacterium]
MDLYFLVNASMDLLCLAMTASILHRAVKRWRLFLAALLGGGWAVGVLLLGIDGASGVVPDLLMAVLLAAVAFAEKNGRITRLLRDAGAYALLSALLGGLMTVLYRFLNRLELPLEALQGDGLSAWMFAILAAVAGFFTLRGGRLFRRSGAVRDVGLEITVEGRTAVLRALVDSGNLLTDPLDGRSVVLADPAKLLPCLSPMLAHALEHPESAPPEYARRIRLIPAHSATGEGLLAAFAPDRLVIVTKKDRVTANDLVALSPLGGTAGGYDALIASE